MAKKTKTLVTALGVLVLLGGGYYGAVLWQKKKAEAVSSQYTLSPKLGNLESAEVARVEANGVVLEKKGETWELVSLNGGTPPPGIELDQGRIQNQAWHFAGVYVDRTVEEAPADISVYGLDNPVRITVTDTSGKSAVYLLGNKTSSQTEYYVMEEGNPAVYIIAAYTAENINLSLDMVRQRALFRAFTYEELERLVIETPESLIDFTARPESVAPYLASSFGTHILTSPYKLARAINGEELQPLLESLAGSLTIVDFVDDNPSSLSPYGLDKPARLFVQAGGDSVDLLIGGRIEDRYFARRADAPGVFTLRGLDAVISTTPFSIVDKFPLLVNIDNVDRMTVSGGEKTLTAEFQGKGDEAVFTLNGKKAETRSFKTFYQAVIGLLYDAEYSGPALNPREAGSITVDYRLNTPPGASTSLTLVPYNRDFYALWQEGTMEFLIARSQVRNMFTAADKVVYED